MANEDVVFFRLKPESPEGATLTTAYTHLGPYNREDEPFECARQVWEQHLASTGLFELTEEASAAGRRRIQKEEKRDHPSADARGESRGSSPSIQEE